MWRDFAIAATVEQISFPGSGHIPILLRVRGNSLGERGRRHRPWGFNAHWIRKKECEEVIRTGWEMGSDQDCFDRIFGGIEECQLGLR